MAHLDDLDPDGKRPAIEIDRTSNGEYAPPLLSFATCGPKSRREFLALWDARGGVPG